MKSFLSLVSLLCVISLVYGYGESDSNGHPNWQERANHVFANAVRISPSQYKTIYMAGYSPSPSSILGSTYPARPPVYLEPKLVNSAYAHSADMATNNCFSHPSCDGTDTFVRIKSYYSCSGTMGENIAAGNADPLDTSNQWLCDQTNGACAADGSGNDGHRSNIMGNGYKVIGVGFGYGSSSTYKNYWTQDFGGASCAPVPTSPIYGGSHRAKSGTTKFITIFYTSPATAPSTASVVIAGTSNSLSLEMGAAGAGVYIFSQTSGTACRSYYFQFGSYRYPETGCLVTYGEGSCTTSFDATCGGTNSGSATTVGGATIGTSVTTAKAATTSAASATTAKASTTSSATTGKVATATTTGAAATSSKSSTTGVPQGSTYYIFDTALKNGWTIYGTITNPFTYSGKTALKATLTASTASSGNFVWFSHSPTVSNIWTTLTFNVAASGNGNIAIYFNGGYFVNKAVTAAWQTISIPLSSLGSPPSIGSGKELVFANSAGAVTLYLNNIALV